MLLFFGISVRSLSYIMQGHGSDVAGIFGYMLECHRHSITHTNPTWSEMYRSGTGDCIDLCMLMNVVRLGGQGGITSNYFCCWGPVHQHCWCSQ